MKTQRGLILRTLTLGLAFLLAGCATHRVSNYTPTYDNVAALKQIKGAKPINLAKFTASDSDSVKLCRHEGWETLPDDQTFEGYINNAMVAELAAAHLYNPKSDSTLTAEMTKIDFNSRFGGSWTLTGVFNDFHQAPYTITSKYTFPWAFRDDSACTEVAQAYSKAVEKFLQKVYKDPHFQATVRD